MKRNTWRAIFLASGLTALLLLTPTKAAVHRAPGQRSVTNEAALKSLAGKQASEKPHRGTRISAIDFAFRRGENTFLSMHDEHVRIRLFNLNAKRSQRVDGVHAILTRQESLQRANAVGQRGDNGGAMRNTLVAGNSNLSFDARPSFYP